MSMSALTGLLAIAERMRTFSGTSGIAHVHHVPPAFAFLADIQFLQHVAHLDLFRWQPFVGDYTPRTTNPHTTILAFPEPGGIPHPTDLNRFISWKDDERMQLTADMLASSGPIFESLAAGNPGLLEQVSATAAELVLNSHTWGRSSSFVGLQKSPVGISVAVCDAGRALLATLAEKRNDNALRPQNHLEAILLASFSNHQDYGLHYAISRIVQQGGWVTISSYDAEVRWNKSTWEMGIEFLGEGRTRTTEVLAKVQSAFAEFVTQTGAYQDSRIGYVRRYPYGLRGVRIAFEIPSKGRTR